VKLTGYNEYPGLSCCYETHQDNSLREPPRSHIKNTVIVVNASFAESQLQVRAHLCPT
jgi:hypothetical protein